ncbi:tyrosine-type recombinase/integrase [Lacinutrix iliipiscaria]|uniref:Tyrosine-type recombinase/integrase n=1 Tax=Lacinutrix iliipiscaria TaxID=1230532 RepID=A0ABW5WRA7_9FLAO
MQKLFGIFDTGIDTRKMFVPMTFKFKKRNYINKDGLSLVYLHVCANKRRERIPLDIYVSPKSWNNEKMRVKGNDADAQDLNLFLDIVWSKITKIKKFYRLSSKPLTIDRFLFEFNNDMPKTNFVKYSQAILEERKSTIKSSTYAKEQSILKKLEEYQNEILFYDINEMFFVNYRHHLANLGNNKATRNGNIKIIKKYLRYAVKAGVKLPVDLDNVVSGSTQGQKSYLNSDEVKILYDYYFSNHIPKNQKLCLGYFLFSCFTGLRSSDVLAQGRHTIESGKFQFTHVKTGKLQVIKLNRKAIKIVNHNKDLFIEKYSASHIRTVIKEICAWFQISKRVDYHMSRHTFGTNYILLGGDVTKLQILMNHSDVRETMVYVHLAELEKNAEADLMDNMF